jgi:hypothetical protein
MINELPMIVTTAEIGWRGFYQASSCDKKECFCKKGILCPPVAKERLIPVCV